MPLKIFRFTLAGSMMLMLFSACVKDVDMDQYEEIIIAPEAALDLVYFNLSDEDFTETSNGDLRAADISRLDFLDDDYIQNNLIRADLNFRFINSFESEFNAVIRLLSEGNAVQYEIRIPIPAGTSTSPATVDYTEIINEDQIGKVRRSIKISVEITSPNTALADGELRLESRGFYYFEF